MAVIEMRADEIIPGDKFDTRCGVESFRTVTKVRYAEISGGADRMEITFESDSMSPTRTILAGSMVRVLVG